METFDQWLERTGQSAMAVLNDPAVTLARAAWEAAKAQSRNYVADEEVMPEKITFANGRVVYIKDNETPGVHNGVYLEVEQLPDPA
jgi:ribosomal protein L10